MPRSIITLTTDFGTGSPYVAQMKGVILAINGEANVVDITHAIPPQGIVAGAIALRDVTRHFPPGTIHVAVVDPGVGTARQIVFAEADGQRYIAPDNGLLSLALRNAALAQLRTITNRALWQSDVSHTFHGRDIMAPVAARLSLGLDPAELGPAIDRLIELDVPTATVTEDEIAGQITHVDSFGNLISNITAHDLGSIAGRVVVRLGDHTIDAIRSTYSDAAPGELLALVGSSGYLEVAIAQGSATRTLAVSPGETIIVQPLPSSWNPPH